MGKYELTISKNYVPEWGVTEAVRELFQNALDQEVISPDNKMFFSYDEYDKILSIGNKNSILEPSSLLLGQTSKLNDELTIGQFGEGYKIAMLILLRNGLKVTFFNYGKREVWKPRFVKSRRYKQDLLTVFTGKEVWGKVPDNSLLIKIEGVDANMYEAIVQSNLHLHGVKKSRKSSEYGRLLEDSDLKGKIFVNGLYVTSDSTLEYGYDFLPKVLKLKRDRSMVGTFDLKTTINKLWRTLEGDYKGEMARMIVNGASDLDYMEYDFHKSSVSKEVYNTFKEQHGDNAVAIDSDTDLEVFMEEHPKCKPIVVSSNMYSIISVDDRHGEDLKHYFEESDKTAKERLQFWFKKLKSTRYISDELEGEFITIIDSL